jgi:hypothetical protein
MQDFQLARLLFERMTSVMQLTITIGWLHSGWDNTMHGPELEVANTLFAAGNAFRRSTKVTHLRLESMDIRELWQTLPKVFPFSSLTHLQLWNCYGTNLLCESLSKLKLDLHSYCDEDTNSPPRPGAVDAFLRSLPPLRQLRQTQSRRYNRSELESFDWTALMTHASSLRCLDLGDSNTYGQLFIDTKRTLSGFRSFCENASDLQQLSIVGPKTEKVAWSSPYGLHILLVSSHRLVMVPDYRADARVVLSEKPSQP